MKTDVQTSDEAARLAETLNAEELTPDFLSTGVKDFSTASKNQVAAGAAQAVEPPPSPRFLGRLLFVATDENKDELAAAFIANLHSPDPEARLASLYGLEGLGNHQALADFALASLRDGDDDVVYAACQILLPLAERDPRLRDTLRSVFVSRQSDDRFKRSTNLLKTGGVAAPEK